MAVIAASASAAVAADVAVTSAAIQGGKLMIAGTTASPNTWVRLDSRKAAEFNVKSGADGAFSLGVVYHPGDCIVELQKLVSPTTLGEPTEALVANCGPVGITPRGPWSAQAPYAANDLVTHDGSSWRAKRDNAGKQPGAAADWELFAAKGESADAEQASAEGDAKAADGDQSAKVAPTGPAGGDLAGTYPNPIIRALRVTTGKIANLAVTSNKLASNSVTTPKIARFAVTNKNLAPNSVGTLKIGDNAVTNPKLGPDAVTTDKVLDETLTAGDLGPDSVGSSEIQADAVTASEIATDAVTALEIATDAVTADEIAANAVGQPEIATDGVGALEVQANAIDSDEISDNTLLAADLAANSVGSSELGPINVRSATSAIAGNGTANATANCLANEQAIGGGFRGSLFAIHAAQATLSGNGYLVSAQNTAAAAGTIRSDVFCLAEL